LPPEQHVPHAQRRIFAMGGGGFTMEPENPALDHFLLTLVDKREPRLLFLPTASGDPFEQTHRFHAAYDGKSCTTTVLSLFRLHEQPVPLHELLLDQDLIYVGGGSMRNMLAIWRAHGIDQAMRVAWNRGIVLAGLSAGAMCWFQGGVSRSGGAAEPVTGLGLLPGSLSVHLDGEPGRLPVYRAAIASGELPPGYAADDGAALLFAGRRLVECVASRAGARVIRVTPDDFGGAEEGEVPVRLLPGAEEVLLGAGPEGYGVSELRALRAGRHRWD
jgi:peptidase E